MLSKTKNTIFLSFAIFFSIELSLQARSHIKTGQSVFNALVGSKTYIKDPKTGLNLLNPGKITIGKDAIIKANSLGLRGEEIPSLKEENQIRIAVLGASTIMGAYSKTNESTMPAKLEQFLQSLYPGKRIRVINAGIVGFGLTEQEKLLSGLLFSLDLDYLIIYPGFNDLGSYCKITTPDSNHNKSRYEIPKLELPNWFLSIELIKKNTIWIRSPISRKNNKNTNTNNKYLDANNINTKEYEKNLEKLIITIKELNISSIFIGNARAFRREMSIDLQNKISQTARFYNPCFNTEGLHMLYDKHNSIIEKYAKNSGLNYFNMQESLPGGVDYFEDATHFNDKGSEKAAEIVAHKLAEFGIKFKEEEN